MSRTACFCVSILVALLLCSPIVAIGAESPSEIIPEEGSRNDSPTIAFDRAGTLWAAWSSFQDGRYRLTIASRSPEDRISEIRYPDSSVTDQVDPVWAFSPEGPLCLIYSAHDGRDWSIRKMTSSQAPETIGRGINPTAVAVGPKRWIAWERDNNIVILGPEGAKRIETPSGDMTQLSRPKLAAGPDGAVWLAWEAARVRYRSLQLQRIDEPGHTPMTVDAGHGINRHASLSVDADGRLWLIFEQLTEDDPLDITSTPSESGPFYAFDRHYRLSQPTTAVRVTDGRQWWRPVAAKDPTWGKASSLLCSRVGTVWLLSRQFQRFWPLCESLGPDGWINHKAAWGKHRDYKESMSLAEAPDGTVWGAFAQHERPRTGLSEAPAWSHLDGPDKIVLAPMPDRKTQGKPKLVPIAKPTQESTPVVTFPKYQTKYQGQKLNVYFGDLHVHSEFSGCGRDNGALEEDIVYSRDIRGLDFYAPGDHGEHLNDHNWHATLMGMYKYDRPGRFVPFMAFEWTSEFDRGGSLYRGHYNPVFRQLGAGERYFSASDPKTNTPAELWTALRDAVGGPENVFTNGHHTSRVYAWLSWCYYDPEMAPLIEIAQTRGSYEYEGCPRGLVINADTARVSGHFVQDGLARGMRFGILAGGDHGGRNLTGVFAPRLDRDSIFDNLRAKRTYGTTGQRMFLDPRVNGHFMGEEFRLQSNRPRTITINAQGTAALTQIDLFRNGRIVKHWSPGRQTITNLKFVDDEPLFARENYYYVRLTQKDGGMAWSSPTWVVNTSVPGQFHFQVGGDELHVVYPEQETDLAILMHNETDKPIRAAVSLDVPSGWRIKENTPVDVTCPAGGWKCVVFDVTASKSALPKLCLPKVVARCRCDNGQTLESPLFVVGSPNWIDNTNKAKLIDARAELTPGQFDAYIRAMADIIEGK